MTIAACKLKEEDTKAQCIFWNSINEVVTKHGFELLDSWQTRLEQVGVHSKQSIMGDLITKCNQLVWDYATATERTAYKKVLIGMAEAIYDDSTLNLVKLNDRRPI